MPKTVIVLGLLLVVAACQSGESGSSTHPGESTSQPASSSSTQTPVLSYPQRPMRDAVTKSRFVATYTIDHEELTIQPPPAGPPAMSERAAISRFRLYGLGYVRRGFAAYGSVTLVPRPLALVRIQAEPAWVITYFARPIPCPGMLPDQAANARRLPLSLQLRDRANGRVTRCRVHQCGPDSVRLADSYPRDLGLSRNVPQGHGALEVWGNAPRVLTPVNCPTAGCTPPQVDATCRATRKMSLSVFARLRTVLT